MQVVPSVHAERKKPPVTCAAPPSAVSFVPIGCVHRRPGEQVSGTDRPPELLHRKRANQVFGKHSRDCSLLPRLRSLPVYFEYFRHGVVHIYLRLGSNFDRLSSLWARFTSNATYWENILLENEDEEPLEYAAGFNEVEKLGDISLQEYVRRAKMIICVDKEEGEEQEQEQEQEDTSSDDSGHLTIVFSMPYSGPERLLLADRLLPYSHRLNSLQHFWGLTEIQRAYLLLDGVLSRMFNLLYTKEKVLMTHFGGYLWYATVALIFASIGLFARARKDVLLILLSWIAATEVFQRCPSAVSMLAAGLKLRSRDHVVTVAQHNIMSFVARKKRPSTSRLMMAAALIGCDDYVNRYWHVELQPFSALSITTRVLRQLEDGWKEYIHDADTFTKFNGRRGQWTLAMAMARWRGSGLLRGRAALRLRSSLQLPFDESVLLWHIATDLCFHHPDAATTPPAQPESATLSRCISNYMAYLLLLRPEMLMPGTRQDLFDVACNHLGHMLDYDGEPPLDEARLAQGIVRKARAFWLFADTVGPLVRKACKLAEALMELSDEEERWKMIEGVWLEMLCYSASRCRGYLHAKSLGQGGEFLSYVWVLLSHMGMDTFADKFQRPDTPEEEEEEEEAAAAADEGISLTQDIPVLEEIVID